MSEQIIKQVIQQISEGHNYYFFSFSNILEMDYKAKTDI